MRSCTVRGLTDSAEFGEEWIRAEKHLCADCRPDAWIIVSSLPNSGGLAEGEDEIDIHLRPSGAIKLGEALAQMGREIEAEKRGKEK